MALITAEGVAQPYKGFMHGLPLFRQLVLMIGLALSVAVGVAAVMWAQTPSYRLLYSNLSERDLAEVSSSLGKSGIAYEISDGSGTIMVDAGHLHDARLMLAGKGLPKGAGTGFELLKDQGGFGVSQFMESARYQQALEGELARTIASINSINSARVHLAIPKKTAFVRERKKATASVTVDLFPGRNLDEEQVAAISHMVAASIPDLEAENVTVIDQRGHLLMSPQSSSDMKLSSTQFQYQKSLESYYMKRIEDILEPIIGEGGVRAQITAVIDFTVTEQTLESFNPDLPAIRSEQTVEEQSSGSLSATGVPGSLSNQAPGAAAEESGATPGSTIRRATRNYELDKTISHIKIGGGKIQRLSTAVVLDDKTELDEDDDVVKTPLTDEELEKYTEIVKEAIGFNAQRGDTINMINAAFSVLPPPEPLPEPSMFEGGGIWSVLKQALAWGLVIFLVVGVLRPVLRELVVKAEAIPAPVIQGGLQEDQLMLGAEQQRESSLATAKTLAAQDPRRVAQVVNNWVATDG